MSSTIVAYEVEIEKIKNIWGSKDKALFEKISQVQGNHLDSAGAVGLDYAYKDLGFIALEDIFFGDPQLKKTAPKLIDDEMASVYGYVYYALCDYFGVAVAHAPFSTPEGHTEIPGQHLDLYCSDIRVSLPIPTTKNYYPYILDIPHEELDKYLPVFLKSSFLMNLEEETKSFGVKLLRQLFESAQKNNSNLVFFNY